MKFNSHKTFGTCYLRRLHPPVDFSSYVYTIIIQLTSHSPSHQYTRPRVEGFFILFSSDVAKSTQSFMLSDLLLRSLSGSSSPSSNHRLEELVYPSKHYNLTSESIIEALTIAWLTYWLYAYFTSGIQNFPQVVVYIDYANLPRRVVDLKMFRMLVLRRSPRSNLLTIGHRSNVASGFGCPSISFRQTLPSMTWGHGVTIMLGEDAVKRTGKSIEAIV